MGVVSPKEEELFACVRVCVRVTCVCLCACVCPPGPHVMSSLQSLRTLFFASFSSSSPSLSLCPVRECGPQPDPPLPSVPSSSHCSCPVLSLTAVAFPQLIWLKRWVHAPGEDSTLALPCGGGGGGSGGGGGTQKSTESWTSACNKTLTCCCDDTHSFAGSGHTYAQRVTA